MTTKEKARRRAAEWRAEHPDRKREQCRRYYRDNKERWDTLRPHRLRQYGITPEAYAALFQAQNGKCAICGRPPGSGKKRLAVDHDHVSGRVRGLLCNSCNLGLGCFEDEPVRLQQAIKYLAG